MTEKNALIQKSSIKGQLAFTAIAALTAAIAAGSCLLLNLPVWAMFIGWVAFFTKIGNLNTALINLGCIILGIVFGMLAGLGIYAITPTLGSFALPVMVFTVGMVVISLRSLPIFNNLMCYFLGLISFFASHLTPSIDTFTLLVSAASIGIFSGFISLKLQMKL
ncbi:hypothetical protein GCM10009133_11730 [Cocleimonas flava]|uniref:Uncharacterized protein DUF1097 n=1 Tax=Cocleimonas flava TaxID=634765 RepID=A0A4R1F6I0_9GAMM|nr:DUF1097 domain-containing protein [Cocleimonas flava]TCJ87538.1 uncharacterized protein DUF1097 [Cocleimonas flava]